MFDEPFGPAVVGRGTASMSSAAAAFTGVDAHAHVFRRDTPMIDGRRYTPTYDAPLAAYLAALDANGLSHGVLTAVSVFGTNNGDLLQALQQAPDRLRGIVAVSNEIDAAKLAALDRIGVVGVRLNLVGLQDPDLTSPPWQTHLRRLADLGWQVEIQAEACRLPRLVPVLLSASVDVVIDHFGRPEEISGVDDPGFRYLLTLGNTGRVWVKLSGAYRNGRVEGDRIALAAASLLLAAFGSKRLLWGSDWPHTCFEDVPDAMRRARADCDAWMPSAADRQAVLVDNPRLLYRFDTADYAHNDSLASRGAIEPILADATNTRM